MSSRGVGEQRARRSCALLGVLKRGNFRGEDGEKNRSGSKFKKRWGRMGHGVGGGCLLIRRGGAGIGRGHQVNRLENWVQFIRSM